MKPEEARIEARAKIIWGEPRENVVSFLQAHGFGDRQIVELLAECDQERAVIVRSSGIKKLTIGAMLVPIPFIAYVIFSMIGVIPMKIFALLIVAGVYGGWKVIDGARMLSSPGSERGDLSALED